MTSILYLDQKDKSIAIWDLKGKKFLHQIQNAHEGPVKSLAVTEGEGDKDKIIVSCSSDKSIAIWNFDDKTLVHRFENAHSDSIKSVTVAGGKYIVSGSSDRSIAIFDIKSKKLLNRFENAHQEGVTAVAATADNAKYIVSGSNDKTLAVWDIEDHKLLHRFENAHRDSVTSVTLTKGDKKYIVSASWDKSIAIWDLEAKKSLYRFVHAHKESVTSVAITKDKKYIISGSEDKSISVWDIEKPLQNLAFIPHLIANSKTYSDGLDHITNDAPKIQDIAFINDIHFLKVNWNFLNFAVFLLPNVLPSEYLNYAVENKIYISLDVYGKSQLDYLLDYHGHKTPAVHHFISIFFKQLSSLMNFNSLNRERLLDSLARLTLKIYNTQTSASLLGFLKCFVRPAEEIFEERDLAKLPNQGHLKNGENQAFIKLKEIAIPSEKVYSHAIEKIRDDSESNAPTLEYDVVLLPLEYDGNSEDIFNILNVFESFGVQNNLFYEDLTVSYLIDYIWEKLEGYLYAQVVFFATNALIYTLFAIYYQDADFSSTVLIIAVIMNCFALAFEGLQASAGLASFLADPWNYFELVTPIAQITSAILYWSNPDSLATSLFISVSVVLLFTKLLITLRMFDQMRHMVRMILEILSESKGFLMVMFTYAFSVAIVVYHNRQYEQDTDGSGIYSFNDVLMEMYAFAINNWDHTQYSGINVPFFIFASFLMPLILLNMIIAHMAHIYERVEDNRQAFDSRERVLMLYEMVSAAFQLRRLRDWVLRRVNNPLHKSQTFYLLVAKKFSTTEEEQVDLKSITDNQVNLGYKMEDRMDKLDTKIGSLKSDLNTKIDNKIGTLKNDLNTKIDNVKRDIIHEILHALGKQPIHTTGKDKGTKPAGSRNFLH